MKWPSASSGAEMELGGIWGCDQWVWPVLMQAVAGVAVSGGGGVCLGVHGGEGPFLAVVGVVASASYCEAWWWWVWSPQGGRGSAVVEVVAVVTCNIVTRCV